MHRFYPVFPSEKCKLHFPRKEGFRGSECEYVLLNRNELVLNADHADQPGQQNGFQPPHGIEEHLLTANMAVDATLVCSIVGCQVEPQD